MLYRFLRWCPGAFGLLLRQKFYPKYVKECGSDVLFGRFVTLGNARDTMVIGSGVVLNDFVTLEGNPEISSAANLVIEDNVFIGTGTMIKVTGADIVIGTGTNIGSDCLIQSDLPVVLDKDVLVAAFCEIGKMDSEKPQLPGAHDCEEIISEKETIIRHGGWLGIRAKIMAGCHIGSGTIVGAHSNVITDLSDNIVAIGDPAYVKRNRVPIKP